MAIYLDYNATSLPHPASLEAMGKILAVPSNPSSVHSFGREAKKHLENSRKIIAQALSAWPNEIIFTASGTEANATALASFPKLPLLVSAVEHSSVLKVAQNTGAGYMKVDQNGVVDIAQLDAMLGHTPSLVSVMLANNETGVIQPIAEIAAICKKHSSLLHCDAVQAVGKIPVDFSLLDADMLTISAHKLGGPLGAAALLVKNNLAIKPLISGGGQELGRRAGTENIAAISGFAAAVEAIDFGKMQTLRNWLDGMESTLQESGAIIFAKDAPRLPNTSCISMPGVGNEIQLIDFDLSGYAVSAGSACSSGRVEISHVLIAMGVAPSSASCAIRISAGWNSTENEVQQFTQSWLKLAARLKK